VSLYVHIPFYEKICFYCGCQTGAVGRRSRLDSYLSALHSELETVSATLPSGTRIGREAFGGGKPQCERAGGFHPAGRSPDASLRTRRSRHLHRARSAHHDCAISQSPGMACPMQGPSQPCSIPTGKRRSVGSVARFERERQAAGGAACCAPTNARRSLIRSWRKWKRASPWVRQIKTIKPAGRRRRSPSPALGPDSMANRPAIRQIYVSRSIVSERFFEADFGFAASGVREEQPVWLND